MKNLTIGKFNVRIVTPGEGYGRNGTVVASAPLVEFYDNRYSDPDFGSLGQFVSRYFVTTISKDKFPGGLSLDGGISEWDVTAEEMQVVVAFLKKFEKKQRRLKRKEKLAAV